MRIIKFTCFFVAFTAILSFTSCKTLKVTRPEEAYNAPDYSPKPSVVNVPFYLDMNDIQSMVNKKVSGLIYEDNSLEDNNNDNIMVKAWKKEDFTIKYENNQLVYRIPLKLWIKAGWKVSKLGITLSDYKELNAEIALKFKTTFYLNKDWSITTFTTSDGYEWLSTPVIKLGPVDVPITAIANTILNKNKSTISNEIDKAIKQNLSLRKYIQDIWVSMQKPIKLNDEYNLWLKLNPQEISSTPIYGQNNKIKISLGVKSLIESYMGEEPKAIPNKGLPDYNLVKSLDNNFSINLMSDISYKSADTLAKKYLKGKTFTQDKKSITITDIKIYGSNDKMVIGTSLKGSINGTIYFTARPVFDSTDNSIKVEDLDFELETKNALLKTANWLLHNKMKKMISDNMVLPIGDKLEDSKKLINKEIANNQLTKNILLNGSLKDLFIEKIFLTPESIKVAVIFKGSLKFTFTADK